MLGANPIEYSWHSVYNQSVYIIGVISLTHFIDIISQDIVFY